MLKNNDTEIVQIEESTFFIIRSLPRKYLIA